MYHADRDKEKVIYGGRRYAFVKHKGQNQPRIELIDATDKSHRLFGSGLGELATGFSVTQNSSAQHGALAAR